MTKTLPRTSLVPFVRVTGACIAVLLLVAVMPRPVRAQWTWHAAVGAQSKDLGHQALAFLPNELWIHEGDTVTWKFETDEIHTVTFLKTDPRRRAGRRSRPAARGSPQARRRSTGRAVLRHRRWSKPRSSA